MNCSGDALSASPSGSEVVCVFSTLCGGEGVPPAPQCAVFQRYQAARHMEELGAAGVVF